MTVERPSLAQLLRLQAQLPVLAMKMMLLQLTARLWQHSATMWMSSAGGCWARQTQMRCLLHMLISSASGL